MTVRKQWQNFHLWVTYSCNAQPDCRIMGGTEGSSRVFEWQGLRLRGCPGVWPRGKKGGCRGTHPGGQQMQPMNTHSISTMRRAGCMDGVNEFSLQNSRLGRGVSEWAQVAAYVHCPGLLNMADISLRGLASTTSFICLAEGSRRDMYIIQGPITSDMD